MCKYVYALRLDEEDDEVFFLFPRFREIVSSVRLSDFEAMSADGVIEHAHDAVITALQTRIAARHDIPKENNPSLAKATSVVRLSVRESMKLELYKVYREHCKSVADFARRLNMAETAARRLLDLRHGSRTTEIERAVAAFGKRLGHDWNLEPV